MGLNIVKTVDYLPKNIVTNDDMAKIVDTSDEWIVQRTGIKSRYFAKNESLEEMTINCIKKFSNEETKSIDLIIVASMSNLCSTPTLSTHIANYLNQENILCLDLNAACSGYVYALITVEAFLQTNNYKKVLLVSAEKMSNIIDMTDRKTNILFGDATSASLINNNGLNNLICPYTKTLKTDKELFINESGHLEMLGQDVFKFAYKAVCDCINYTLNKEKMSIDEIDYFLLHQANIRILNKVAKKFDIPKEKILINIQEVANTSSASIPLLLAQNSIPKNKTIFLCGFGAGLSFGSVVYKN